MLMLSTNCINFTAFQEFTDSKSDYLMYNTFLTIIIKGLRIDLNYLSIRTDCSPDNAFLESKLLTQR